MDIQEHTEGSSPAAGEMSPRLIGTFLMQLASKIQNEKTFQVA